MKSACEEDSYVPNVDRATSSPRESGLSVRSSSSSNAEQIRDEQEHQNLQYHLTFRVTGAASIARLEPLLLGDNWGGKRATWSPAKNDGGITAGGSIDLVWETTVSKKDREEHRKGRVLNRLSGAQVRVNQPDMMLTSVKPTSCTTQQCHTTDSSAVFVLRVAGRVTVT